MSLPHSTSEIHKSHRIPWLRAAVLGANDGILSTASLIVGVSAAHAARTDIMIAGIAGLVAGAVSMAAGEYVSVSSQADTEAADLALEQYELKHNVEAEEDELAAIYMLRGLDSTLAMQVAKQLMAFDALSAHARDELGISEITTAKPMQAAFASAVTFALGALLPLLIAFFAPLENLTFYVSISSLFFLCTLGTIAARAGGANCLKGALRVTFWGAFAMGLTALIGALAGHVI